MMISIDGRWFIRGRPNVSEHYRVVGATDEAYVVEAEDYVVGARGVAE
jgi:hypothetical protein